MTVWNHWVSQTLGEGSLAINLALAGQIHPSRMLVQQMPTENFQQKFHKRAMEALGKPPGPDDISIASTCSHPFWFHSAPQSPPKSGEDEQERKTRSQKESAVTVLVLSQVPRSDKRIRYEVYWTA